MDWTLVVIAFLVAAVCTEAVIIWSNGITMEHLREQLIRQIRKNLELTNRLFEQREVVVKVKDKDETFAEYIKAWKEHPVLKTMQAEMTEVKP